MENKLEQLWANLQLINKETCPKLSLRVDPNEYRLDDLGAIVKKSEHGKHTEFGWTIDHICPRSKGGGDNINNLQILHWSNNRKKDDQFPTFHWDTQRCMESNLLKNITETRIGITYKEEWVKLNLPDIYPRFEREYDKMEVVLYL